MIQLDGSTELQDILDGVFRPPRREERRERQRFGRSGVTHYPLLTKNYPGADGNASQAGHGADAEADRLHARNRVATTEEIVQAGYAEGRVINPPPPIPANGTENDSAAVSGNDPAGDPFRRGYLPPMGRIWSDGV